MYEQCPKPLYSCPYKQQNGACSISACIHHSDHNVQPNQSDSITFPKVIGGVLFMSKQHLIDYILESEEIRNPMYKSTTDYIYACD